MPARGRGSDAASGPQRVFLHIGPPKTGTTYVQSVLFGNRRRLRADGVLLPGGTAKHFGPVGDLRGRRRGRRRNKGAWERLAAEVRAWPGTSVVSCEWFAFCTHEQAARALGSFGTAEVHVVITLRDLGRIVPAVWQEQIKNGKVFSLAEFLDLLAQPLGVNTFGTRFWLTHDTRELLDRWAPPDLPDDRIHLVTLPRSGADPDELWRRFGSLFLADTEPYDTRGVRANPGLGLAEVEVLRRVNDELDGRMRKSAHAQLLKHLVTGELTKQSGGGRLRLPTTRLEPLVAKAEEIVSALAASGHPVVGDLGDLKVDATTGGDEAPEQAEDVAVATAAVKSIVTLLLTMQSDGAHRRKVWRRTEAAGGESKGTDTSGRPAEAATALARRAKGLLRRASTRLPARKSARG